MGSKVALFYISWFKLFSSVKIKGPLLAIYLLPLLFIGQAAMADGEGVLDHSITVLECPTKDGSTLYFSKESITPLNSNVPKTGKFKKTIYRIQTKSTSYKWASKQNGSEMVRDIFPLGHEIDEKLKTAPVLRSIHFYFTEPEPKSFSFFKGFFSRKFEGKSGDYIHSMDNLLSLYEGPLDDVNNFFDQSEPGIPSGSFYKGFTNLDDVYRKTTLLNGAYTFEDSNGSIENINAKCLEHFIFARSENKELLMLELRRLKQLK